MKHSNVIENFLAVETENIGGYGVSHGWDISIIETLLPAGISFPKIFKELYNSYSFDTFDTSPITFLANNDGNASEAFEYFEQNKIFVAECCSLGYLPFARCETGLYDPVCFDLSNNNPSRGDYPIVILDHECILQFNEAKISQYVDDSLYKFMLAKIKI